MLMTCVVFFVHYCSSYSTLQHPGILDVLQKLTKSNIYYNKSSILLGLARYTSCCFHCDQNVQEDKLFVLKGYASR